MDSTSLTLRSPCPCKDARVYVCLLVLVFIFLPKNAVAGGPIHVSPGGEASFWDSPITLHPEAGSCGPFDHDEMLQKIADNISVWENVDGVSLSFELDDSAVSVDITGNNFNDYFSSSTGDGDATDDINPVMFDDDGAIVVSLFGSPNQFFTLGFAGPDAFDEDEEEIVAGQALFNCLCLLDEEVCGGVVFTEEDLNFTVTHEIGHMIGLDHTQINQPLADAGCDLKSEGDCDDVPAMYPQSVDAEDQVTPQRDDEVALLSLYGLTGLDDNFCTVTGTLKDKNDLSLRCADVQAETGDATDTIGFVSGATASYNDTNGDGLSEGDGECLDDCGKFILRGLDPQKEYVISVKPIDASWIIASGISPCVNGQVAGIVEEVIATVTAGECGTGETLKLGTIVTQSSGGIEEGDSSGGDDKGADGSDPFEGLSPLIDCSLTLGAESFPDGFFALCCCVAFCTLGLALFRLDNS